MIGDRWGVTDEDAARHYPCDDVVPSPVLQAWRAVTVQTSPERLWPWVTQIRLAPYSYDWIDNLGRRSPPELRILPEPVAGDPGPQPGRPGDRRQLPLTEPDPREWNLAPSDIRTTAMYGDRWR